MPEVLEPATSTSTMPWANKSSALISDRLHSSSNSPSNSQSNTQGKDRLKDLPKSKEIRKLEALAKGIRSASGKEKDPKGGCFCQGAYRIFFI